MIGDTVKPVLNGHSKKKKKKKKKNLFLRPIIS